MAVLFAVAVAYGSVLAVVLSRPRSGLSQAVGDLVILAASALALASCSRTARKGGAEGRAWAVLAVAMALWTTAQLGWTVYGLTRNHVHPFPAPVDFGFVGYSLPTAAALLMFPRSWRRVSRPRELLDAAVIATSVLFVSWATVLGPLYQAGGSGLPRLVGLAYPIVDVTLSALVLTLGMRAPTGQRQPWLLVGSGLVLLAVTDSFYVSQTLAGETGMTGSLLALGWMSAFVLIAAAAHVGQTVNDRLVRVWHFSALQELLPYLPLVCAVVVASARQFGGDDVFLTVNGGLLLLLVIAQQVVIAKEKVSLANGMEATIDKRTAELSTADARFRALVESSDDAIFSKTPDGQITSWNAAAEHLFGYTAAEIVGKEVDLLVPETKRREELEIRRVAAQGDGFRRSYETERQRKNGTVVPVALTVSPIYDAGVVTGVSVIARDITEEKARERELASARSAELELSRAKSDFLATMSHEIRTPMNAVIGMTGLLLDTQLDAQQREFAETARNSGEALLEVINDILDFSKIESGKLELDSHPFEVQDCLENALALVALTANTKNLELVAHVDDSCPQLVVGDVTRFQQVLVNLLSNAVKFTAGGEVVVMVSAQALTGENDGPLQLTVSVRDTGMGIPPDRVHRLFQPFSQVDSSTTRVYGGTGLGLVISRRLAQAMDGDLQVTSQVGVGSTFTFTATLTGTTDRRQPATGAPTLVGTSVLVVDDNATNRRVLELVLRSWGMTCTAVATPAAALQLLTTGCPVDVALLDMKMPGMDGGQLALAIRELPSCSDLPLMLLTSLQWRPDPGSPSLFAATLSKPIKNQVLRDKLLAVLAPVDAALAAVETAGGSRLKDTPAVSASPLRVLLAEDNPINQQVAQHILRNLGYARIDTVSNGLETVHAVRHVMYDVVLMDLRMPQMDGLNATRAIRAELPADRQPYIVAITASALVEDRAACMSAGMDDYLTKPLRAQELSALLKRVRPRAMGAPPSSAALTEAVLSTPKSVGDQLPLAKEHSGGARESAIRCRLNEMAGPDPEDDKVLFSGMLRSFIARGPGLVDALDEAIGRNASGDVEELAHAFKGTAASLGGNELAPLLENLELQARLGRLADTAHDLPRVRREFGAFSRSLATVASELERNPRPRQPLSPDEHW